MMNKYTIINYCLHSTVVMTAVALLTVDANDRYLKMNQCLSGVWKSELRMVVSRERATPPPLLLLLNPSLILFSTRL
jgi:hypothetical protein